MATFTIGGGQSGNISPFLSGKATPMSLPSGYVSSAMAQAANTQKALAGVGEDIGNAIVDFKKGREEGAAYDQAAELLAPRLEKIIQDEVVRKMESADPSADTKTLMGEETALIDAFRNFSKQSNSKKKVLLGEGLGYVARFEKGQEKADAAEDRALSNAVKRLQLEGLTDAARQRNILFAQQQAARKLGIQIPQSIQDAISGLSEEREGAVAAEEEERKRIMAQLTAQQRGAEFGIEPDTNAAMKELIIRSAGDMGDIQARAATGAPVTDKEAAALNLFLEREGRTRVDLADIQEDVDPLWAFEGGGIPRERLTPEDQALQEAALIARAQIDQGDIKPIKVPYIGINIPGDAAQKRAISDWEARKREFGYTTPAQAQRTEFAMQPVPPAVPVSGTDYEDVRKRAVQSLKESGLEYNAKDIETLENALRRRMGVGPQITGQAIPGTGMQALIVDGEILQVDKDPTAGVALEMRTLEDGVRVLMAGGKPFQVMPAGKAGEPKEITDRRTKLFWDGNKTPAVATYNGAAISYDELEGLVNDTASPTNDIAIIFKFMNVVEPGGIVREGEQIMLQKAGSYFTGLRNLMDQAKAGTMMQDSQRRSLLKTAETLRDRKRGGATASWQDVAEAAVRANLDPRTVVPTPFHRDVFNPQGGTGTPGGEPMIEYDKWGNRIN